MTCSWTSSPTRPSWNWSSLETAQPLVSRTNMYKDVHLLLLFISRLLSNLWRTDVYIPQSLFFFNMCWMCLQTACMSQPLGPLTCVVPVYFPDTDCFLRLFAVLSSWFFFFSQKTMIKKADSFFWLRLISLMPFCFSGLMYVIETQKVMDLKVNLMASYVIIPQTGFYNGTQNIVLLDLGHFQVRKCKAWHWHENGT